MDRRGERGHDERVATGMGDVGPGGADRVVGAEDVHRQGALEDLRVTSYDRQLRGDPGVGHDDVQAAEPLGGARHRPLHLLTIGHVAGPPGRAAAGDRDLLEPAGLEPRERDPGAARVQAPRGLGADAAGGARDEHAAAGQGRHGAPHRRRRSSGWMPRLAIVMASIS
jgi:hypothetical protein